MRVFSPPQPPREDKGAVPAGPAGEGWPEGCDAHARSGAGAMAEEGAGVRGWLLQLQEFVSAADRCSAAGASYQLIRSLGQECVLSTSSAVQGG